MLTRMTEFCDLLHGIAIPKISTSFPSLSEVRSKTIGDVTLFASPNLYLLHRYYMILYERLVQAKELATEIVKVDENRPSTIVNEQLGSFKKEEKDVQFKKFLTYTTQFANNELDASSYELYMRDMLGYQSWFTHTLDKLVSCLIKQLIVVFTDTKSIALIKAFFYESQRTNPFTDSAYVNVAASLNGAEKLYSIQYQPNLKQLSSCVVDPIHIIPVNENGKQYLEKFVSTSGKAKTPFLKRCVQKPTKEKVVNVHGLECRLLLTKSKLVYIEDTEDFFYRPSRSTRRVAITDKSKFLSNWANTRLGKL